MDFNRKVTVITGGGKGLGKALAQAAIQVGAQVVITSPDETELRATAAEIGATYFVADASSPEATEALATFVIRRFGRLDIWINNAGIQIAPSYIEAVDITKLHRLFDINFFGYYYGCATAARLMKQQGEGVIITINSTAGLAGKPGLSAYVSSKFAVKGLSETIREELRDTNIKLYQIFPGGIQTDMYHEKVPVDFSEYMSVDYAADKIMQNFEAKIPDQDLIIRRPAATEPVQARVTR